ncbi:sugar ABC transporter ATP-binding protein [Streptomyces sp. NPDC096057]|uniref:sugar ABC transporter ATP-binding protein n=1 Tax=Streptomyces sp. NPDC096057 TaxID=3155543 RepID=UPI00332E153C
MSVHDALPPALEASGITKAYPGVQALSSVTLRVAAGEVHALLGENGAGKSTLIKIVTGAERPDSGEVRVAGRTLRTHSPRAAQRLGVRVVHQERQIAADLTIGQNVLLGNLPGGAGGLLSVGMITRRAQSVLDDLGLDLDAGASAGTLSAAEQQLVELARAVSKQAPLVVMDEPTASLRRDEVEKLFRVIRALKASGTAVLYISHHLHEVFETADRATVLRNGCKVADLDVADTSPDQVVELMFDRQVAHLRLPRRARHGEPRVAVSLDAASAEPVLRPTALAAHYGEVLALCGAAGSGTTEVAELLAGVRRPSRGSVLRDRSGPLGTRSRAADGGIGFVPADRKSDGLLLGRSITENVAMGPHSGLWRYLRTRRFDERAARRALTRGGVSAAVDPGRVVSSLSGGNQQRVVISRWLRADSRVMVLDQPTAGVDIAAKFELYREILALTAAGIAVVVVSSDYEEICCLADRVVVMCDGRIGAVVSGDDASPDLLYQLETGISPVAPEESRP